MQSRFTEWMLAGGVGRWGRRCAVRVLDVGFGTGLSAAEYPADVQVVGIDCQRGDARDRTPIRRDTVIKPRSR